MKNKLLKTICCFTLISSISSCLFNKECKTNYHFEFSTSIFPASDTVLIGDTIWISIAYNPDMLLDLNTNTEVNVVDFNFNIDMDVLRIDSIDGTAYNHFEIIQDVGELTRIDLTGAVTANISFDMISGLKEAKFGIIPEMEGIFSLGFNSFYETGDLGEIVRLTDSNCNEYLEKITFNSNNGADNNIDLYMNTVTELPYIEYTAEFIKEDGTYAFVVKE